MLCDIAGTVNYYYKALEAVNYYHKALHLGCCSSLRSVSDQDMWTKKDQKELINRRWREEQESSFITNLRPAKCNHASLSAENMKKLL